jgi:hypothetical protein
MALYRPSLPRGQEAQREMRIAGCGKFHVLQIESGLSVALQQNIGHITGNIFHRRVK